MLEAFSDLGGPAGRRPVAREEASPPWSDGVARALCRAIADVAAELGEDPDYEDIVRRTTEAADAACAARRLDLLDRCLEVARASARNRRFLADVRARRKCYACHGAAYWVSDYGVRVCATCHPRPVSTAPPEPTRRPCGENSATPSP